VNFKWIPTKSIREGEVDILFVALAKKCFEHGTTNFDLVHEALGFLGEYFAVQLDKLYPTSFVVAISIAKAHYKIMTKVHGFGGNRDQLPWNEINTVHRILAEYLTDNEPEFGPDKDGESREEIVTKVRMLINHFTTNHHRSAVGPAVWSLLTKDAKQAN